MFEFMGKLRYLSPFLAETIRKIKRRMKVRYLKDHKIESKKNIELMNDMLVTVS